MADVVGIKLIEDGNNKNVLVIMYESDLNERSNPPAMLGKIK